jgi:predicted DNA-binding transcriptional regulator AlpA
MTEKLSENTFMSACSVAQMAAKLGLSRARFYQLQNQGIFPPPVYLLSTQRPFYTSHLEQQCIAIRKTGIAFNGQPVIFYTHKKTISHRRTDDPNLKQFCEKLSECLRNMHTPVPVKTIAAEFDKLFPEGLKDYTVDNDILKKAFIYFTSQKSNGV